MSSVLNLYTDEYERDNIEILENFPAIKIKFRDTLQVSGAKFNYLDISKVYIKEAPQDEQKRPFVTPAIFSNKDDTINTVDYIGVYSIGMLELLYLVMCRTEHNLETFHNSFSTLINNVFKDYSDIEKVLKILNNPTDFLEQTKALNIFYNLRTGYSRKGYKKFMKYANNLMIIWLVNPKLYWEIFFEIMDFCKPFLLVLLETSINDYLNENGKELSIYLDHSWLEDKYDLDLTAIKYSVPNSKNSKKITNCRGTAIYSCISLYYGFLCAYGYDIIKEPILKHDNSKVIAFIMANLTLSFGDDNQKKVLMGESIDTDPKFDLTNTIINNLKDLKYNFNTNQSMLRSKWEELVLFYMAYTRSNEKIILASEDINMHYANKDTILSAIGDIILNSPDMVSVDTTSFENQIKNLMLDNSRLSKDVEKYKQKIQSANQSLINNEEIDKLKLEIENLKTIIESKSDIIEQLTSENKELNSFISNNIYTDEELDNQSEDDTITLEEMIIYINDFKFTMIGGRFELLPKLDEYGWTNVDQFDYTNKNIAINSIKNSDFYVVNTKFISHKIVRQVESVIEDDSTLMYYNGTNPEKLIKACYEFAKSFLE